MIDNAARDTSPPDPVPVAGGVSSHALGRRAFMRLALAVGLGTVLSADSVLSDIARPLPISVNDTDTANYLHALTDLSTTVWTHLAITAAILDPGPPPLRSIFTHLPQGSTRSGAFDWTYRADARRVAAILSRAEQLYASLLPSDRLRYYATQFQAERYRLAAGGQVDYPSLYHLVTQINREQGMMAHPELDDLLLVRDHHLAPANQPRAVPTLLAERQERRTLASTFRQEAARLLNATASATFTTAHGTLTVLADLGAPATSQPTTYQVIPAPLPDLDDATIAEQTVYFTAGDFLGLEPPTPPDRWADRLPASQRADAPANALSPRLSRRQLLAPAYASRILWASVPECRTIVATLRTL